LAVKSVKIIGEAEDKKQLVALFVRHPLEKSVEELKEFEPELFGAVLSYLDGESTAIPDTLKQKISQYEPNEAAVKSLLRDFEILKFLVGCSAKLTSTKTDLELKYSDIEKLANGEVEFFVCELMERNLIECKMNQLDQTLVVQTVKCRGAIEKVDWKIVDNLVQSWTTKMTGVLASMNTPINPEQFKLDVTRQQ